MPPDARSPELLPALLAGVADGVYVVGADGSVEFVNPAGMAILGCDDEPQLLGRPSHRTIHAHHRDGSPYPEDERPLLLAPSEAVQVDDDWFVRRDGSMVPVAFLRAVPDSRRPRRGGRLPRHHGPHPGRAGAPVRRGRARTGPEAADAIGARARTLAEVAEGRSLLIPVTHTIDDPQEACCEPVI